MDGTPESPAYGVHIPPRPPFQRDPSLSLGDDLERILAHSKQREVERDAARARLRTIMVASATTIAGIGLIIYHLVAQVASVRQKPSDQPAIEKLDAEMDHVPLGVAPPPSDEGAWKRMGFEYMRTGMDASRRLPDQKAVTSLGDRDVQGNTLPVLTAVEMRERLQQFVHIMTATRGGDNEEISVDEDTLPVPEPVALMPEQVVKAKMLSSRMLKNARLNNLAVSATAIIETEVGLKSAVILDARTLVTTRDGLYQGFGSEFAIKSVRAAPRFNPIQERFAAGQGMYKIEDHPTSNVVLVVFSQNVFFGNDGLPISERSLQPGDPVMISGSPYGGLRQRVAAYVAQAPHHRKSLAALHMSRTELMPAMIGGVVVNDQGELVGIYNGDGQIETLSSTEILALADVAKDDIDSRSNTTVPGQRLPAPRVLRRAFAKTDKTPDDVSRDMSGQVARFVSLLESANHTLQRGDENGQPLGFNPFVEPEPDPAQSIGPVPKANDVLDWE